MSDQETLLQFPCEFPIKVMGKAGLEFEATVLQIIRKHVPDLGNAAVTVRHSKDNNFAAITVMITATSKEQIDAIYFDLTSHDDVLMAL